MVYLFVAVLGLCCCAIFPLVAVGGDVSLAVVPGFVTAVAAKSLQLCPTLCDPIDGSPPGSPVPGILQAKHWSGLPFRSPMRESEK